MGLFRPGKTGCWECLAQGLRANSPVATYLQERNGHVGAVVSDRAVTPATLQIAWGLAANAVASWVVRGELPDLDGKVQTLDVPTWRLQSHTLVRLPFCPRAANARTTRLVPSGHRSWNGAKRRLQGTGATA